MRTTHDELGVMIRVAIVGAAGYVGEELTRILRRHPRVRLVSRTSRRARPGRGIKKFAIDSVLPSCDIVFFALPHTQSMHLVPHFLSAGRKVIDLGADYRLRDASQYEHWYRARHKDKGNVGAAVYGLSEVYRDKIKGCGFVANPGCYPTAALLALAPLFCRGKINFRDIIIDAKSGISGAGRKQVEEGLSAQIKDNFYPYKINRHQHTPEINQGLSAFCGKKTEARFVPHLLPIFRGLSETIYLRLSRSGRLSQTGLVKLYRKFYKYSPFVRILPPGQVPRIKDVAGTNFCHLGLFADLPKGVIVIVSAIDNLIKGAAGQAVQNMNLIYGWEEKEGLVCG
ncbi:MAG: N-acetyl-gamma-glutamyl-phosphate reductase [Candidatus Omnitrophota bacterium]